MVRRFALDNVVFRYVLVGLFGALLEVILFTIMFNSSFSVIVSNVIAFHIAFICCYFLHYYFTHKKPYEGGINVVNGFLMYMVLMYSQLIVGTMLLFILIEKVGVLPMLAKVSQILIVTPIGFFIQKKLIFKKRGSE